MAPPNQELTPAPAAPPITAAPRITRTDFAVVAGLLVLWLLAYRGGLTDELLVPGSAVAAAMAVVSRLIGLRGHGLVNVVEVAPWPGTFWHRLQCALRWVFWTLLGAAAHVATPDGDARTRSLLVVWSSVALLMLAAAFARIRVRAVTLFVLLCGTVFLSMQLLRLASEPSDAVLLRLPFEGEWMVVDGGPSELVNDHYRVASRRGGLDFTKGPGVPRTLRLESHPCFEQRILAPADGVVVDVVEALRDNPIGGSDRATDAGNHVVIDIGLGRYLLLANLREDSVPVGEGDRIVAGQIVGRCGNSGDSGTPGIHLRVTDRPSLSEGDASTYPVVFRNVGLRRGGDSFVAARAQLRRGDRVRPEPPRR